MALRRCKWIPLVGVIGRPETRQKRAGNRKSLGHSLHSQRLPASLALRRNQPASVVKGIEVSADNIRIENRRQAGPHENRNLTERVLGEDLFVSARRAGLVRDDMQAISDPCLVCEYQRFTRIRGVTGPRLRSRSSSSSRRPTLSPF